MLRNAIILLMSFAFCNTTSAQEVWSLQKCLLYAKENNIQLKQSDITIENAILTKKQNKLSQYPNLNGTSSYSYNAGRTIDPTTNDFITAGSHLNQHSLSTGMQLYGGFVIKNSIKQSEYDLLAAKSDRDRLQNDLGLNISLAYLNVLLAEDQVEIVKNRLIQTERQLEQTDKMIEAGSLPKANRYTIAAQIAMDEQAIIGAENALDVAYVNLKNNLDLNSDFEMVIERPEIKLPTEEFINNLTVEELYQDALNTQPQIKGNEYRKLSAEKGVDIAKGRLQPTLSAFGQVGTRYSSSSKQIDGFTNDVDIIPVDINGSVVDVGFPNPRPNYVDYPYFDQLNANINQSYGLRLNIPIYSNGTTRIGIERARLNVVNTEYSDELTRRQLRSDIQRALADAKAASKELAASEKSLEAQEISYEMTEKRYKVGAATTFEFTNAKDNVDIAKSNVVGAKYTYIFRLKVLEFYQGKAIQLN